VLSASCAIKYQERLPTIEPRYYRVLDHGCAVAVDAGRLEQSLLLGSAKWSARRTRCRARSTAIEATCRRRRSQLAEHDDGERLRPGHCAFNNFTCLRFVLPLLCSLANQRASLRSNPMDDTGRSRALLSQCHDLARPLGGQDAQ
jgi:hypothetical protein